MLELDQVAPSDAVNPNAAQVTGAPAKFAALRNADCRPYLFGAALAMMADNIEHVITYCWSCTAARGRCGARVSS